MRHILRRGLFMAAVAALLLAIGVSLALANTGSSQAQGLGPPTLTDTQTVLVTDLNRGEVHEPGSLAFAFSPKEKFSAIQDINGDGFPVTVQLLATIAVPPAAAPETLSVLLNDVTIGSITVPPGFIGFPCTVPVTDATLISPGVNTIVLEMGLNITVKSVAVLVEYTYR